jgi:methylisocitrate lyase
MTQAFHHSRAKRFRELLQSPDTVVIPGCYDAIGARLIEDAGFDAVYMSGMAVAASLGYADVGIIGCAEMSGRAGVVAGSVGLPLFADADSGYGGPNNIIETVRAFERAGAAGIHLEDQPMPKKCAVLAGKSVVPIAEMLARIEAACRARRSEDFVVVGRTDALSVDGFDAAIDRAVAYEKAGADATMVMGLSAEAEMRHMRSRLRKPSIVLMTEGLRELMVPAVLTSIGIACVIYPLSLLTATVTTQRDVVAELKSQGTTARISERMASLVDVHQLMGIDASNTAEARYAQTAYARN